MSTYANDLCNALNFCVSGELLRQHIPIDEPIHRIRGFEEFQYFLYPFISEMVDAWRSVGSSEVIYRYLEMICEDPQYSSFESPFAKETLSNLWNVCIHDLIQLEVDTGVRSNDVERVRTFADICYNNAMCILAYLYTDDPNRLQASTNITLRNGQSYNRHQDLINIGSGFGDKLAVATREIRQYRIDPTYVDTKIDNRHAEKVHRGERVMLKRVASFGDDESIETILPETLTIPEEVFMAETLDIDQIDRMERRYSPEMKEVVEEHRQELDRAAEKVALSKQAQEKLFGMMSIDGTPLGAKPPERIYGVIIPAVGSHKVLGEEPEFNDVDSYSNRLIADNGDDDKDSDDFGFSSISEIEPNIDRFMNTGLPESKSSLEEEQMYQTHPGQPVRNLKAELAAQQGATNYANGSINNGPRYSNPINANVSANSNQQRHAPQPQNNGYAANNQTAYGQNQYQPAQPYNVQVQQVESMFDSQGWFHVPYGSFRGYKLAPLAAATYVLQTFDGIDCWLPDVLIPPYQVEHKKANDGQYCYYKNGMPMIVVCNPQTGQWVDYDLAMAIIEFCENTGGSGTPIDQVGQVQQSYQPAPQQQAQGHGYQQAPQQVNMNNGRKVLPFVRDEWVRDWNSTTGGLTSRETDNIADYGHPDPDNRLDTVAKATAFQNGVAYVPGAKVTTNQPTQAVTAKDIPLTVNLDIPTKSSPVASSSKPAPVKPEPYVSKMIPSADVMKGTGGKINYDVTPSYLDGYPFVEVYNALENVVTRVYDPKVLPFRPKELACLNTGERYIDDIFMVCYGIFRGRFEEFLFYKDKYVKYVEHVKDGGTDLYTCSVTEGPRSLMKLASARSSEPDALKVNQTNHDDVFIVPVATPYIGDETAVALKVCTDQIKAEQDTEGCTLLIPATITTNTCTFPVTEKYIEATEELRNCTDSFEKQAHLIGFLKLLKDKKQNATFALLDRKLTNYINHAIGFRLPETKLKRIDSFTEDFGDMMEYYKENNLKVFELINQMIENEFNELFNISFEEVVIPESQTDETDSLDEEKIVIDPLDEDEDGYAATTVFGNDNVDATDIETVEEKTQIFMTVVEDLHVVAIPTYTAGLVEGFVSSYATGRLFAILNKAFKNLREQCARSNTFECASTLKLVTGNGQTGYVHYNQFGRDLFTLSISGITEL